MSNDTAQRFANIFEDLNLESLRARPEITSRLARMEMGLESSAVAPLVPMPPADDGFEIEWDDAPATTPTVAPIEARPDTGIRISKNHANLDSVVSAMPEFASTVTKVRIFTADGAEVPGSLATVRTYPSGRRVAQGVVGSRYRVCQDEVLVNLMRPLETNGTLSCFDGGTHKGKIWLYGQARFERNIVRGDSVQARMIAANSHDGSIPTSLGFPCVRPVCQNTLAMALSSKLSKLLKVRHTMNAGEMLAQAQAAIEQFGMEFITATDKMRAMASTKITTDGLKEYTGYVFSRWADEEEEETAGSKLYAKVLENFESGQGAEYHRGTVWGAYNAVTEYTTHQRSRSEDPNAAFADNQWGAGALINKRAFERALELV